MRIALLADIHGNYRALEACLGALPALRPDVVALLGDYVTDCPYPERTISLLRQCQSAYDTRLIRGNREDYLIAQKNDPSADKWSVSTRTGNFFYTYQCLQSADIDWFAGMPADETLALPGCAPLIICHGSPGATRRELKPCMAETKETLLVLPCGHIACGHTHQRYAYQYAEKWLHNGGSVGMPVSFVHDAQFMMLSSDGCTWLPEYMDIPYDIDALLRDYEQSGILDASLWWGRALMRQLKTGENMARRLIDAAIAQAPGVPYREIPESAWARGAKSLGL